MFVFIIKNKKLKFSCKINVCEATSVKPAYFAVINNRTMSPLRIFAVVLCVRINILSRDFVSVFLTVSDRVETKYFIQYH